MTADTDSPPSAAYTVRDDSNYLHRMYYFLHRFGLQSGVVGSARYTYDHGHRRLTKPQVYAALHRVIAQYPELAMVGVVQPSPTAGLHRLKRALLHRINLDTCTQFVDSPDDGVDARLLEKFHRQWLWTTTKPDTPWWQVVVINGRDVVFFFHHFVCDGRFIYTFHRALAEALNALPAAVPAVSPTVPVDAATVPVATMMTDHYDLGGLAFVTAILSTIYSFLYHSLIRLFYGDRMLFAGPSRLPFVKRPLDAVVEPSERVVGRVASQRIPAPEMRAALAACRAHKTTFTPLLAILFNLVLATEYYPAAKLGFSYCAVDTRPILPKASGEKAAADVMNASSTFITEHRLKKLRRAALPATATSIDAEAVWKLVHEYGTRLRTAFQGSLPAVILNNVRGKVLGLDLEDMLEKGMSLLGLFMSNSFILSSLGPFSGPSEGWQIDEIQFAAAVTQRSAGVNGLVINVAGIKGGDTIINISYEDGVLEPELVEGVLRSVVAKIGYLTEASLGKEKWT